MVNIKTNKRLLFCYFILAICFFGLIFTFYKYSVNFNSNAEGFVTLPQPVTYSKELIKKYPNAQENYGDFGVSEKDFNDHKSNKKWNWTDQFTQDFKKLYNLLTGRPLSIQEIDMFKTYNPQNGIIYGFSNYATRFGESLNSGASKFSLKCDVDASGNSNGPGMMYIDSSGNKTFKYAKNEELPYILPGFAFINDPCNPCNVFNKKYDCPFIVPATGKDGGNDGMYPSAIMQYMWGVAAFEDKQSKQVKDKLPVGGGLGGDASASKSEDKGKAWSIF